MFNDADRFLNNGAAKSCVLLVLMVSRQSFSVTSLGDIFLTSDTRVLEKRVVTEYPWRRSTSGQMQGCILTAVSTALPVETGNELQQDELHDNDQRTCMAIRWAVLRRCYDLPHAVDLLAATLGHKLRNDFVKHRLTKGIRSDGHLRVYYWMGDQPAMILQQLNGEFGHEGNTDMHGLSDCMREIFDKLLFSTQLCYFSMVESTDQAIVRIPRNWRGLTLTSPRTYWHPDDETIVLYLVLCDLLLRVAVNERFIIVCAHNYMTCFLDYTKWLNAVTSMSIMDTTEANNFSVLYIRLARTTFSPTGGGKGIRLSR